MLKRAENNEKKKKEMKTINVTLYQIISSVINIRKQCYALYNNYLELDLEILTEIGELCPTKTQQFPSTQWERNCKREREKKRHRQKKLYGLGTNTKKKSSYSSRAITFTFGQIPLGKV